MLPPQNRLRAMKDFDRVYKKGKSSGNRYLSLKSVKTSASDPIRIAFIISNKTEKLAVKRNQAKRQVREAVHLLLPKLKPSFDVALTIKARLLPLSFKEKQEQVVDVLRRAGLLVD